MINKRLFDYFEFSKKKIPGVAALGFYSPGNEIAAIRLSGNRLAHFSILFPEGRWVNVECGMNGALASA